MYGKPFAAAGAPAMLDADFAPPLANLDHGPIGAPDASAVAAADHAARNWTSDQQGALRPGTQQHANSVARMFTDTFNPYKPAVIDWPQLDPEARARLINLPIWDIAVQTEGRARLNMLSYARTRATSAWAQTVALNGWEEERHRLVLSNLVASYGITLSPEPAYAEPRDTEWAYLVTGFSECIDSFFAFGLFAMAQRSGFFPQALVDTFEPVMQEECRHILLFANWLAAHRATMTLWRRPWFELRVAAVWAFLAYERMGIARGMDGAAAPRSARADTNFTVTGAAAVSDRPPSLPELLALCLAENDRRFAGYDPRLRRPTTVPFLTRTALKLLPRRRKARK
jgi:hypothetical protein